MCLIGLIVKGYKITCRNNERIVYTTTKVLYIQFLRDIIFDVYLCLLLIYSTVWYFIINEHLAAPPDEVNTTIMAALTVVAARTFKKRERTHIDCCLIWIIGYISRLWEKAIITITADDATDSAWDIGSPTCLATLLNWRDWLQTTSAYKEHLYLIEVRRLNCISKTRTYSG